MAARSYDLTDEKETQDYLRDVEIEYQFQCFDQKEPDGCHRLAEFRENIKKHVESAGPLYKDNCDQRKYPKSCYKYGQCLLTGQGAPDGKIDLDNAIVYYEKACNLDHPVGCEFAAQLRMSKGGEENIKKAVDLYQKACNMKDGDACLKLSAHYLTGTKVVKDLAKAFDLAKKGCELGNIYSCGNLSLMYKNGHGTERNLALADEAKQKAIKLKSEVEKGQPKVKVNA